MEVRINAAIANMQTLMAQSWQMEADEVAKVAVKYADAQMEYLKNNYSTTRNIDLAKTLGISLSKLNKLAKELALTKQN